MRAMRAVTRPDRPGNTHWRSLTRRPVAADPAADGRAGVAATTALQARLDASPRVHAQQGLAQALGRRVAALPGGALRAPVTSRAPSIAQRRAAQGVVQRVIYPNVDALLAAALGGAGNVPDLAGVAPELRALWGDAEAQLPLTDVIAVPGLDRTARAVPTPAGLHPYRLQYDPHAPDADWLTSSLLHELIHVSTAENYEQTPAGAAITPWLNFNLPPGLAAPGPEIEAQQDVLEENLDDFEAVVRADGAVADPNWVLERIDYSRAASYLHYDTVLADILSYLDLSGDTNNATYRFARRLSREATDRRLVAPWWGTKRARRVERNAGRYEFWKW